MNRANGFWLAGVCAVVLLFGIAQWFHATPVHAQQDRTDYEDGYVYVYAEVDVDSNYYLYTTSYAELDFDADEEIEGVGDEIQVDQDQQVFYDDYAYPDYYFSEYPLLTFNPVPTGHEYGVASIGWVCVADDYDEDDDCDWYQDGYAYASLDVTAPPPHINTLSTYAVTQGDKATLTVSGMGFVQGLGDQLAIFLGSSTAPFTATGTPTATAATFSYDFTAYPPGTYFISVMNNEGTSNNVAFTVNSRWPVTPCDVGSSPKSQYSSLVSTGTTGSGSVTVSFSGAAYSAVSQAVPYGPYSTPSSVAASIAALVTANYTQYGLTARAFGANVSTAGLARLEQSTMRSRGRA